MSFFPNILKAKEKNLQFKLGESISIYSEKAYKRNKGNSFEAIGNVVILSTENTLYGEKASISLQTGQVKIEGNVRFISSDLNIYGSAMDFNFNTNSLEIKNARVVTSEFNIIASSLKKTGKNRFHAVEAQFTTCKDCRESWSVFGEDIFIELDKYVQIYHALARVKGISVLYFPYIFLPIKTKRESGLLFPSITSTFGDGVDEGIIYEQPIFWSLDVDKDMTFSPRLLGNRGYGLDYEYRHIFNEKSWLEIHNRALMDSIYLPGKINRDTSDTSYFRNFFDIESHYHFSDDFTFHFKGNWPKDMDMFSDFDDYMRDYTDDGNAGIYTFFNYRSEDYFLAIEGSMIRNNAVSDPLILDEQYVQTLPSIDFSLSPKNLFNTKKLFLQKFLYGTDLSLTRFVQGDVDESQGIRNALRLNARPYVNWSLFDIGATHFSTKYIFDSQTYRLFYEDDTYFSKYANIFQTTASFSLSKIFGEARVDKLIRKDISQSNNSSDLIGTLPDLNDKESLDYELVYKNSYKHTQEYNFIHHYTSSTNETGNSRFKDQISDDSGWFDYDDALREDIATVGINDTRTRIPVLNTFEFQWNNTLVKKSLVKNIKKDKFNYAKVGYFNLSQGLILGNRNEDTELKNKLTRLFIDTGYIVNNFNFSLREYYFHTDSTHKLELSGQKTFDRASFLTGYSYNSLEDSQLKTIKLGATLRLIDIVGLSVLEEFNLDTNSSIRRVYQADYMPNNDCWILSLRYRKNPVDERISFNFQFNFGNKSFANYKDRYFELNRNL